jgi:hypothetical protein
MHFIHFNIFQKNKDIHDIHGYKDISRIRGIYTKQHYQIYLYLNVYPYLISVITTNLITNKIISRFVHFFC